MFAEFLYTASGVRLGLRDVNRVGRRSGNSDSAHSAVP